MNSHIQYILDNEKDRKQCPDCSAIWFLFDHHGKDGVYRLGMDEPSSCGRCLSMDKELENNSVLTTERWFSEDDL